jgi:hypothetical protein
MSLSSPKQTPLTSLRRLRISDTRKVGPSHLAHELAPLPSFPLLFLTALSRFSFPPVAIVSSLFQHPPSPSSSSSSSSTSQLVQRPSKPRRKSSLSVPPPSSFDSPSSPFSTTACPRRPGVQRKSISFGSPGSAGGNLTRRGSTPLGESDTSVSPVSFHV